MLTREWTTRTPGQDWYYTHLDVERVPFLWHYHPEFELTLTLGATGLRYIGDDIATFGEADLALVAPNQAHTWAAHPREDGQPHRVRVIKFSREWIAGLARNGMPEIFGLQHYLDRVHQGVVFSDSTVRAVQPLFARLAHSQGLARIATLLDILGQLPADAGARHLGEAAGTGAPDPLLEKLLAWLQARYLGTVSLDAAARDLARSPATLKRCLARHRSGSFVELVQGLRLGHACHLLISTDLPVALVSDQSGFGTHSHFYRRFRERYGMTPDAWRRRHRLDAFRILTCRDAILGSAARTAQ